MWIAIIAATLMSLIGYQSLLAETNVQSTAENTKAEIAAADMATYRSAVVAYAAANPLATSPIPSASLTFPTGYAAPTTPAWSNYIATDGTIVIYCIAPVPAGLNSAINRLVGDSTMVIETDNAGEAAIRSTTAALDAMTKRSQKVPNAPVWFAHRG